MESAVIVVNQVGILFLLVAAGYLLYRLRLLKSEGIDDLTRVLLYFVVPFVIVKMFLTPFAAEHAKNLLLAFISALFCHGLAMLLVGFFYRGSDLDQRSVLRGSVVLSNSAFMAIPLLTALLGVEATLYLAPYLAVFNVVAWTYLAREMQGSDGVFSVKKILLNPTILAVAGGLLLYFTGLPLPSLLKDVVSIVADTNSPLAMLIIGAQIAHTRPNLRPSGKVLLAIFLKNILLPILVLLALLPFTRDRSIVIACLIPAASPTAATVVLFATRFRRDVRLASQTITLSTLFSIVSLPLLVALAERLLGSG